MNNVSKSGLCWNENLVTLKNSLGFCPQSEASCNIGHGRHETCCVWLRDSEERQCWHQVRRGRRVYEPPNSMPTHRNHVPSSNVLDTVLRTVTLIHVQQVSV